MIEKTFDHKHFEKKIHLLLVEKAPFDLEKQKKSVSGGEVYTIMLPPPNVTGSLHIGHALCYTIQDILVRYSRARGKKVLWQPGLDHAGIVTQLLVEKDLAKKGISHTEIGREAFIQAVWKWKEQSGGTIVEQMKALGASCDWSRLRFTMDDSEKRAVRQSFIDLYKAGLIYRDRRLVNWDPQLESALSDLEIVEREVWGHLWSIHYPLAEGGGSITVATTRPETLFGDAAVAVHPNDSRYTHLIGQKVRVPLTERLIPIVADNYADPEKGSGAVKITPAHDFNDFEVARRHKLPLLCILDRRGCLNENVPERFRGLDRSEARTHIVNALTELGLLEGSTPIQHHVPHGDRSGTILEPYLTDQWFVDAEKLAAPALKAAETGAFRFVPENWVNTYFDWMRHIRPWCISRQIWWGHEIPAWYGPDGRVFVAFSLDEAREQARNTYSKEVPLTPDPDVLDTWFSSALWPFMTLGWPEKTQELENHYPSNVLVTGFDIIFFWVARMVMMGLHFCKEVPFKDVFIHPLVRDEKGQKMSKSRGNVIDPMDLIDHYGADALRLTLVALCVPGRDVRVGKAQVENYRNFLTKIWNAVRFSQLKGCQRQQSFDPYRVAHPLARWIVWTIKTLTQEMETALQAYRFDLCVRSLYQHVWGTFCDWYLELIKPILEERAVAQELRNTTSWAIEQILRLMNPIAPFVTEELASILGFSELGALCQETWPAIAPPDTFGESAAEIDWICGTIKEIRSVRAAIRIPAGAELKAKFSSQNAHLATFWDTHKVLCARLARICPVDDVIDSDVCTIPVIIEGGTISLFVGNVIDIEAERKRLNDEETVLAEEKCKLEERLNDQDFQLNAPPYVIDKTRIRLEEISTRRKLLAPLLQVL
ncbi:MAG: valine--tRNA ligase [Holosporales bacterium]|jgi:valyl-tRNA synthetase|nr:valine--tRNA ligase [Holosporales bacterium]